MAGWPTSTSGLNYITYPVGPTPLGTTVTASGSTNTKGSYTELAASTPFTATAIVVTVQFAGDSAASGYAFLLDIATGAAASESVLIPDLMVNGQVATGSSNLGSFAQFTIPIAIASGTRLSARCACNTASKSLGVVVTLLSTNGLPGMTAALQSYGVTAASSRGTAIDPGGSTNTKGSYTQLTASTSAVSQWLMLIVGWGANTAPSTARWYLDIATGGAGSETVLIPDIPVTMGGQSPNFAILPVSQAWLTYIASSTRIAVRASCSINDATDRKLDVAILTGTAPTESGSSVLASAYVFGS